MRISPVLRTQTPEPRRVPLRSRALTATTECPTAIATACAVAIGALVETTVRSEAWLDGAAQRARRTQHTEGQDRAGRARDQRRGPHGLRAGRAASAASGESSLGCSQSRSRRSGRVLFGESETSSSGGTPRISSSGSCPPRLIAPRRPIRSSVTTEFAFATAPERPRTRRPGGRSGLLPYTVRRALAPERRVRLGGAHRRRSPGRDAARVGDDAALGRRRLLPRRRARPRRRPRRRSRDDLRGYEEPAAPRDGRDRRRGAAALARPRARRAAAPRRGARAVGAVGRGRGLVAAPRRRVRRRALSASTRSRKPLRSGSRSTGAPVPTGRSAQHPIRPVAASNASTASASPVAW